MVNGNNKRLYYLKEDLRYFVYQKALIHIHFTKKFYSIITFVISHYEETNSIGNFVLKTRFQTFALKIPGIQK